MAIGLRQKVLGGALTPQKLPTSASQYVLTLALTGIAVISTTVATRVWISLGHQTPGDLELGDKFVWATVLACGAIALFSPMMKTRQSMGSNISRADTYAGIALVVMSVGLLWTQREEWPGFWYGFDLSVFLFALALIPVSYWLIFHANPGALSVTKLLGYFLVTAVYLPLVLQPAWGLSNSYHARYVFNEFFAASAGNLPLSSLVPQYSSLLGYPFEMMAAFVPALREPSIGLAAMSSYVSALSVLTLALLIVICALVLPQKLRGLAPLIAIPLAFVHSQPALQDNGSVSAIISSVPVRTLPLVAIALTLIVVSGFRGVLRPVVVGFIGGLAFLNNFEFGIVCLIAAVITTGLMERTWKKRFESLGLSILSALGPIAIYAVVLSANGIAFRIDYLYLFALNVWQGWANYPMNYGGAQYFIAPLLVAGIAMGAWTLVRSSRQSERKSERISRVAASISLYFGLAGIGSFGYFVGRSIASTQLQIFLFFVTPIIASSVMLVLIPLHNLNRPRRHTIVWAAALLPLAVSFAAVIQAPDMSYEWARVIPDSRDQLKSSPFAEDLNRVQNAANIAENTIPGSTADVSIAVSHGNFVSFTTGWRNVSRIDEPHEAHALSTEFKREYCDGLRLATKAVLAEAFISKSGLPACEGFDVLLSLDGNYQLIKSWTN